VKELGPGEVVEDKPMTVDEQDNSSVAQQNSALALLRTGNVSFSILPHIFLPVYLKVVYTLQSVSCTTGWLKRFEYSFGQMCNIVCCPHSHLAVTKMTPQTSSLAR